MVLHRDKLIRWSFGVVLAVALGLVLLWVASQATADFPTATTPLSGSSVCDIEPRAAVSDDGQWIAATWIQGRQIGDGCVGRGTPVVRWATEGSAQTNWGPSIELPLPGGTMACAVHTDVAIDGTTAHVAATYWLPCDASSPESGIRYFTCDLSTHQCQSPGDAYFEPGLVSDKLLSDVRITLDSQSGPHIAYARGNSPGLDASDVLYTHRLVNGAWETPVIVSETGSGKFSGAYRPGITAANGRIHIVWERHRDWTDGQGRARLRGDVQYRYCDASTGSCGASSLLTYLYPEGVLDDTTYPVPSIDARDDRVVLVWNICADVNTSPPCDSFYLLYSRSNDNGQTWPIIYPKQVGTEYFVSLVGTSGERIIPGSDDWTSLGNEYASYARPSVALDGALLPHVGWQHAVGSGYVISTTHATASTDTSLSWADHTGWQIGTGADTRIAATVLPAADTIDPGGLHIVHMDAWSELIVSTPWSRSQVYYDYLGDRRPFIQAETPDSSHVVPDGRAATVRARVTDLGGSPIGGATVSFSTDFGAFSYYGYGQPLATRTTDGDGWVGATVYANMAGSANVQVWLDGDADLVWDEGEPSDVVTRTWTVNATPAVHVGTEWSIAGDLVTTTVAYHPYETDGWPDQPTPYVLWWCPQIGGQPAKGEVMPAFSVSPATWSLADALIQIPWASEGLYRLESFRDYGEEDPCGSPAQIAASAYISITDTPPPGTPWLTVDDAQPSPGDTLAVTFWSHPNDSYELWWCPASGDAAPVTEQVGSAVVAGGVQPTVPAIVPAGIQGYYRLESHRAGGACGQTATRQAISSLLAPNSAVFLPLVVK